MRVLIDECVDPRVKLLCHGHVASTVHEKGWDALADGQLLDIAQHEFDVLLTIDRNLPYQQNLKTFDIAIIVMKVPKNQLPHFEKLFDKVLKAIDDAKAGQAIEVA